MREEFCDITDFGKEGLVASEDVGAHDVAAEVGVGDGISTFGDELVLDGFEINVWKTGGGLACYLFAPCTGDDLCAKRLREAIKGLAH